MRRIITALLVLLTTSAIAQNGGQITGKKNSGLTGTVMVDSVALKVSDSASRVYLSAMKLKSDSIYKRMYQDSVNLAKLGTGVTITGSVTANLDVTDSTNLSGINSKLGGTLTVSLPTGASTETTLSSLNSKVPSGLTVTSTRLLVDGSGVTQPVSVSGNVNTTISNVTKKTLGTAVVSADTGLVVNAVMHGLATGGGGGYVDLKVNPSGSLNVEATLDSATQRSTMKISNFPATQAVSGTFYQATQPISFTRLKASTDTVAISGTITATAGATTIFDSTYTAVQMDTAGLGAMANSATVGWQSDSVGLRQWKCTDVKIGVKISMANTAPANDKAVYVYVYPMWYDGSSTWYFTSGGTITSPSGANSTYTIASPNNLRLLGVLSYTTTNMVLQDQFVLSNAFGSTMPDAFGLVIVDFSGAAIHTTNHRIYYSLINKVQR